MLLLIQQFLHGTQEFTTNLKQQAYTVSSTKPRTLRPALTTNADEADLRVWLHCKHSQTTKVLIYSPDTDVYHIGMTKLLSELTDKDVIIQLSKCFTENTKFIHLNKLLTCFDTDPDLIPIPKIIRPQVMQTIYISTGCDYISFFCGIGKVSFLSTFFQHASFIAGGLEDISYLFFLRLVGCAYYRKYASAFASQKPETIFYSIAASSTEEKHVKWLQNIRTTVHQRAERESDIMPSTEALRLHWQRCMWVRNFWRSALDNQISLPELTKSGWRRDGVDGRLEVHWEVEENVHKAQASVDFMLSGCRCKSGCSTKRCSCQRKNRVCGPSCHCYNCSNVHQRQTASTSTVQEELEAVELMSAEKEIDEEYVEESDNDEADDDYLRLEREVDEIMKFVFGEESDDYD